MSVSRKSRLCRCEARLCNLPPPVLAALLRLAFADRRRHREALIYPGSLGEASSPSYLLLLLRLLLFLAFIASSHSHPARFCSCAFAFMPLTALSPSLSSQIYCIENAHGQLVRDLDFNPNRQYYLASCGDDCKVKFWDVRSVQEPVKTLEEHSHWWVDAERSGRVSNT